METIAEKGRRGDKVIAHLTPGEVVIPKVFAENNELRSLLDRIFKTGGVSLDEFTVGSGSNKVNPETGYLEFDLTKEYKDPFPTPSPLPMLELGDAAGEDAMRRSLKKHGRRKSIITGNLVPMSTGRKKGLA